MEQVGDQFNSGHFTSIDDSVISETDLAYYNLKIPIIIIQAVMYGFFLIGFFYISFQQATTDVFLSPYVPNTSYCEKNPNNKQRKVYYRFGRQLGGPARLGFNPICAQHKKSDLFELKYRF